MKKRSMRKVFFALCAGSLALSACIDKDYDLNNLDTTMKIGDGIFMLPQSSTEDIQLHNLFSLTEGGAVVEMPDGLYYLHKGGSSVEQNIHLEDIAIPAPNINPFSTTLNGQEPTSSVKAYAPKKEPATPSVYLWEYPFEGKTILRYDDENSNEINADVMRIENIKFGNDQRVSFTVRVSDYGNKLKNLRFGTLTVELPLGFDIAEATYNDGNTRILTSVPEIKSDRQVVSFDTSPLELAKTQEAVIELKLAGAYIGNGGCFSFQQGAVPMQDKGKVNMLASEVKILGDLHVAMEDIDQDRLTPEEQLQIVLGDYGSVLPDHITFTGEGEFHNSLVADPKLHVSLFTGAIHHAFDKIEDIQLNDLPDFLIEDDVNLDLANPQLFLKVNTDLPAAATIRGFNLTSYPKNVKENPYTVTVADASHPVTFKQSANGYVVPLVKQSGSVDEPEEYAQCTYGAPVEVKDLEQLLVKVPDHMTIFGSGKDGKLVIELNECVDLPVNADYKVQFDYLAHCKLTFGPNFQLVYRTDETGIELGSDLDNLSFGALIIEAQVTSTVPLDIQLDATPIDKNGNVINGLAIVKQVRNGSGYKDTNPLVIRAKADGTKDADNIRLLLKATSGNMNDYLRETEHQFDGLKLKASLINSDANNVEALKADSYIKLTNVRIGVDGGITIQDND
ncbi:MAG: hypothetical protein IJ700_04695 [Bacteroidaceae bacterium]|nr:hypothetical protein [Bacteroidaceae bacterium]